MKSVAELLADFTPEQIAELMKNPSFQKGLRKGHKKAKRQRMVDAQRKAFEGDK